MLGFYQEVSLFLPTDYKENRLNTQTSPDSSIFILPISFLTTALPVQYKDGSAVELKVNKITSLKHVLGYPHYSLGFCKVRMNVE
jgi:hypothetical protein